MSIWIYNAKAREPHYVWSGSKCRFCNERLELVHKVSEDYSTVKVKSTFEKRLWVCPVCGWWKAEGWRDDDQIVHPANYRTTYGAVASLRELDLSDISMPMEEIRSYLAARYETRFTLNPRRFEETVASVFANLGYDSLVTAYSGDGGIDVILRREDETIGVQVKRYKDSVSVEQIRSLAGALVYHGITRGIFVTTSTFQSGAGPTTEVYKTCGYELELVDAARFYDKLKIAQRDMYESFADFPVADCLIHLEPLGEEQLEHKYTGFFARY